MKKLGSLLALSLFFSLQVFQLCDETHDACAALIDKIQILSQHNDCFASPTTVDDPDASLPLIAGQTLSQGRVASNGALVVNGLGSILPTFETGFIAQIPTPDRSPPWVQAAGTAPPLASLLLSRTSVRILAPPLS
jgi:hypothetical protein